MKTHSLASEFFNFVQKEFQKAILVFLIWATVSKM